MRPFPLVNLLVSVAVGAFAGAATSAHAATWYRTVSARQTPSSGSTFSGFTIPFVSDTLQGAAFGGAGGNGGVTAIYVDYSIDTNPPTSAPPLPATELLQACGVSFNLLSGQCGAPVTNVTGGGTFDVSLPLWTGSQSPWDYFWVSGNGPGNPIGIGVAGDD